jgi:catechol 2,3-dioxygenase-like lactoylglutathione lyase family enzyme
MAPNQQREDTAMAASQISFNFTKLVVGDLDASARFYGGVFGLSELMRFDAEIEGRPIREILYAPTQEGGATFVLLAFVDAPKPAAGEVILGFTVGDLDAVVEAAVTAGATVADPIRTMSEMNIKVAFLRDPEGRLIEVVQMLS